MSSVLHKRYPGTRPFQDTEFDRLLFKGREDDLERFLHLVLAERLVVLFSKSGMGKTSLLNAGVSQPLRARDYVPIPIRLSDPNFPLMDAIDAQVRCIAAEMKIEFVAGDKSSLWKYFKTAEFWGEQDVLLTPVLMFDQFEEIFSLEYSQQQQDEFFKQLADLVNGQHRDSEKSDIKSSRSRKPEESLPNMKIILSLREDYLANLEEINADIPSIFRNRFRLRSLMPERARQAITEPASLEHPALASTKFSYDAKIVDLILTFLQKGETERAQVSRGLRDIAPWAMLGLAIILFSYLFDPVIDVLGDRTVFMRQPGVMSVAIAFASIVLAYCFPMKPLVTAFATVVLQGFSLVRYWSAVGTSEFSVEGKILSTTLIGASVAGWISWLRMRQSPPVPRNNRQMRITEIEPFQIQLLCQHIEEIVLRRQGRGDAGAGITITERDLGGEEGMQSVLKDFYRDQMKRLTAGKWWLAHKLCESGFISMTGRRLSLDGEFIADKYKVSRALLDELIDKHLVRAESRLGSHYYELSHDSLVKPIQETARQRLRTTRIFLLLGICGALLFFVGKGLMEKASVAEQLVAARNTLNDALRVSMNAGKKDSLRFLLGRLDTILQLQDSLLDLGSYPSPTASSPMAPSPTSPSPTRDIVKTIYGTVLDAKTGREITGADILLDGRKKTISDSKGEFVLDSLSKQEYTLIVQGNGYRGATLKGIEPGSTRLLITLDSARAPYVQQRRGSIFGRVIDADNDAVNGARIMMEGTNQETFTQRGGRFTISEILFGKYRMKFSGFAYQEKAVEISLAASKLDAGDIRLLQGTERPTLMNPSAVEATYPREALALRVDGTPINGIVRVKVVINAQGKVTDVIVLDSVHPLLDSAAVTAARKGVYKGSGYDKLKYSFRHPSSQ